MNGSLSNRVMLAAVAVIAGAGFAACGRAAPPTTDKAAADEVAAAWVKAFDAGDAAAVAGLYAEDAHSMPPGGGAITGRSGIESVLARGHRIGRRGHEAHAQRFHRPGRPPAC